MTILLQGVLDAVSIGGLFALMALGIGLIFGIMRLINFAHGELITIGGYAMVVLADAPPLATAILTLLFVILLALVMERLAFRPLRQASLPTLLIASFAVSYLLQNVLLLIFGGNTKGVNFLPSLSQPIEFSGLRITYLQTVIIVVTIVLLVAVTLFLKRTRFGIQMRAAAEDFRMAQLVGIGATAVAVTAFATSGFLASVVSLLYITQIGVILPQTGLQPALFGFVATVLGGLGSLLGAAVGGFVIGCLAVVLQIVLPLELRLFRDAFLFAILFAVLLIRPQGFIVVRWARERV
ncbi:MAG: branched-chain amino acid ABC transporter permease [Alphaproteobacteria bacterium]|nr:branched-chain amino acid ABC transporter permease [Alphaproteobacteria bacterium]